MRKDEYFLKALSSDAWRYKAWALSAFSVQRPAPATVGTYPYQLFTTEDGVFYADPEQDLKLSAVQGAKAGEALLKFKDRITLKPGDLENVVTEVETNYGNAFFNRVVLVYAFGSKFPFMTGTLNPRQLENMIEPKYQPDPEDPAQNDPNAYYVSEKIRFDEAMFWLVGFTQLCVPSATPKTLQTDPKIHKRRDELLKQHEGKLNDPAVIAEIEKELIAMDREYMKGDLAEGFYLKDKSYSVVRKKLFLMHGAESGFRDGTDVDLIRNSLEEGWDMDNLPAMVNSLREGSYNRGAQTALGGEAVKFLGRMFQNAAVVEDDCGTTLGINKLVDRDQIKRLTGSWVIAGKGLTEATPELLESHLGQWLTFRTPLYCKTERTGFCARCMGTKNAASPTSLGLLGADVGSQMMYIFMSAMHGKKLATAEYNIYTEIT